MPTEARPAWQGIWPDVTAKRGRGFSMAGRDEALDHVVVVLFENRSLDNMLGRLYGPSDGKTFEGVLGKDLSNPIPDWAEHGADRKIVPYTVATDMDSPNPDSGEEWRSTDPATAFRRSSSPRGSRRAPCSTTSTATLP